MKKLIYTLCILGVPFYAQAEDIYTEYNSTTIEIISLSKMDLPPEIKQDLKRRKKEENLTGYQHQQSEYAEYLMNLQKAQAMELVSLTYENNPVDTHLKKYLSEIPLVFKFKKMPEINHKNIIGYAAVGSYLQDQYGNESKKHTPEGWTGIKVFFTDKDFGTCSYSFFDLKASNGGVILNKEYTKYIVNHKPTSTAVEGEYGSGFLYEIDWYGDRTLNELSCAKSNFDKNLLNRLIKLATRIDKSPRD